MSGPLSANAWRIERAERSPGVYQGLEVGAGPPDSIWLVRASLAYGQGKSKVEALSQTTLRIAAGDFVALVGPSGCGKSTILKLVSGLLHATTGHVFLGAREVGAHDVRVGIAFQNPTLLPRLSMRQNAMLPLKIVRPFRAEWRQKKTQSAPIVQTTCSRRSACRGSRTVILRSCRAECSSGRRCAVRSSTNLPPKADRMLKYTSA